MRRLSGFAGAVVALHLLGWGLFWWYSRHHAALAGLGTIAYAFGLRHAVDADHIAAIDNTTRKLLQDGKRPLGVGFFFSLGHATIVFALVAVLAVGFRNGGPLRALQSYGGYLGPGLAGTFLWIVGILNLVVLVDLVRVVGEMRRGCFDGERLERRLLDRGFLSRVFMRGIGSRIRSSWQMYPVGALFGLSFDTATEVALLAVGAGAATHGIPFLGVISLPLLFAAGMSLVDTITGGFMREAYGWAVRNPVRSVFYNVTVTSLSVAVALIVGTVLLLQVAARALELDGGFWTVVTTLDLGRLGFAMVAISVVGWAGAVIVWRAMQPEERLSRRR
jgi:nickel/cobalt transporter (NiCoT) family protein